MTRRDASDPILFLSLFSFSSVQEQGKRGTGIGTGIIGKAGAVGNHG